MTNEKPDHDTGVPHNPDAKERSDLNFPVVGLGASAGGFGALKSFFEQMPAKSGMTFVVILHLSPRFESTADKVLQAATRMPVTQVTESVRLEPNKVYVISPKSDLQMSDGYLRVTHAERTRGPQVAIDLFFRTLADTHQDKAVGIVLSGTGADGSVGIARIKEQGGVTFVQSPDDAEYDGMPRNAIASEQIDFVLPAAEMPNKLVEWWNNARAIELPKPKPDGHPVTSAKLDSSEAAERALRDILDILAARSGHDFRHYKRATVLRRIERRMQVNLLKDLPAYREFLHDHMDETRALLDDMLIGVTQFFRDRESFETLEREVIPEMFANVRRPEQVRVWVPGCATGEEAYSIAMLLADHADTLGAPPQYQVFATDIDEGAIAFGRAGLYPESIITDVPPSRLRQFFTKEQHRYRIGKPIRDRMLFALHNVLRDPPFSRVDLISCRNLLIYLDRDVQRRLLEMFHFALRPGGMLFLGSSESADAAPQHFETVDKHHRIYRARALARSTRQLAMLPIRAATQTAPAEPALGRDRQGFSFADVHQRVLEFYAPPSVIVDYESNIVHLSERAGRYLHFGPGEPSHNLVAVADPALKAELRSALFQAVHTHKSVEARVRMGEEGKPPRFINIVARPFRDPEANAEFVLVLFDEVEDALGPSLEPPGGESGKNTVLQNMEEELQRTRERLQTTIEQYETSNEELKASNEELQAINEELRSASEELETSKEELQSVNEELTTVNFELKNKVEETAKINDDLQNFISSTDIATIFVDPGLRIKRFTPRIASLFNIIPGDVGRSLLDITNRLDYPQLAEDATAAFESLRTIEREVRAADGRWYLVRTLPYRTSESRIDGAVLSFLDAASLRLAGERVAFSESQMQMGAETSLHYAIIVLDDDGLVTAWNSGAEAIFGYSPAEMTGQPLSRLFAQEENDAGMLRHLLDEALAHGFVDEEHWYRTKRGDRVFGSGVMTRVDGETFHGFVKIARDTTLHELRGGAGTESLLSDSELRGQAEAASALKDDFLAVISHELKNPLNLISVNAELLKRHTGDGQPPQTDSALEMIRRAIRGQTKIIDDLLDMSRVRTGKLDLHPEAVDLVDAARHVVEAMHGDAVMNSLELALEVPDTPVMVRADPGRLDQMAWNLVNNAIKFTQPGGRVEVRVRAGRDFGALTVADNGQGIASQELPRIFEMFGQAPGRALSGRGGLGIGLALVKRLAERHGGRIEAHSEGLGKGARFELYLPLFHQDELPQTVRLAEPAASAAKGWDGVRVLIADDAADTLASLAQLLGYEGAIVTVAADGEKALEEFGQQTYDIVFADIGMPKMDGYEFAQRLREAPGGRHVPLVAMTGFTREHDVRRAFRASFDAHVGKPLTVNALTATMQRLLEKRRGANGEATRDTGESRPDR